MSERRWRRSASARRPLPAELVERYVRDGWWTDATLGGSVAEWLAAAPDPTVDVH